MIKTTEGTGEVRRNHAVDDPAQGQGKRPGVRPQGWARVVLNVGPGKDPLKAKDIQYTAATTTAAKK